MIKKYIAVLLQSFIWSGYTIAEWLSGKDHLLYKVLLFIVFFYLAFLIARKIVKTNQMSLFVTMISLTAYSALYLILQLLRTVEFS